MALFAPTSTLQDTSDACRDAIRVLIAATKSCSGFFDAYQTSRTGKTSGNSTDHEEDLLRAMTLFAASGLDAVAKQLLKDCLRDVTRLSPKAMEQLEKSIARSLSRDGKPNDKLLARFFVRESTFETSLELVHESFAGESLQSRGQLERAAAAFGIPLSAIVTDNQMLDEIFRERNFMAHEMDVDLLQNNRSRRQRGWETYRGWTVELLTIADRFIVQTNDGLKPLWRLDR